LFRLSHGEPDRRYRERSEGRGHFQFVVDEDRTEPANGRILAEIPRLIVSSLEQLQTMRTMASTD
jgi:hypothetical protein